jgi:hypothetical protein
MMTTIAILLLLLTVTLGLGGGLYEVLVIYRNWKHDVDPDTLLDKLESSGQNHAGKGFWPLVSPAQSLLSIVNIVLAWSYQGPAHSYWLAAAITVFASRVITFAYFIPVMLTRIMKPQNVEAKRLQAIVNRWTALSPVRLLPELIAWLLLTLTLMRL